MFEKQIKQMVESCCEEILHSSNKNIKKAVKRIVKDLPEDHEFFLNTIIREMISQSIVMDISDGGGDQIFEDFLVYTSKGVLQLRNTYIFKVILNGQENQLQRQIRISSKTSLADLVYTILAAFNADGSHFYTITYKRDSYYCDMSDEDEEDYASMVNLDALHLKEGEKLSMCYDFNDNFNFTITFVGTQLCASIEAAEVKQVLSGKGYGIWEEAHYEMDLFNEDPKKFYAFLKKEGKGKETYPTNEKFDLEKTNELLEIDFLNIKSYHEGIYEDEEFYEDRFPYLA